MSPSKVRSVTGAQLLITGVNAVTGTCFAVLAGLSISAAVMPVRRFHTASVVIAVLATCLGYLAFRAALAGKTDEETVAAALRRGTIGALVGLAAMVALLLMFGAATRGFLAHALGKPASSFTTFRLLLAAVVLGFGAGFAVPTPTMSASPEDEN